MAAPFRLKTREEVRNQLRDGDDQGFKEYLGRLLKLIPAEIVGLYMIGSGFIPSDVIVGQLAWSGVCLILIIVVRIYGTADKENDLPYQGVPVFISTVAFLIWIYWLGGPFVKLGIYISWFASILVLICSFLVPLFYKGPKS
jgi:hypothetical protein